MIVAVAACGAIFWSLRNVREHYSPTDRWINQFRSGDPADRCEAVQGLGDSGPAAVKVVLPVLIAATKDPDVQTRAQAIFSMRRILDSTPGQIDIHAAIPALLGALKDPAPSVRNVAVEILRVLPMASPSDVPSPVWIVENDLTTISAALVELLGDRDADVRVGAVKVLAILSYRAGLAPPPVLVDLLRTDPSAAVRGTVAESLPGFRVGIDPAVEALFWCLEHDRTGPRMAYETSIGYWINMGMNGVRPSLAMVPMLRRALASREPIVAAKAADALAWVGPGAREAYPDLLAMLREARASERVFEPGSPAAAAAMALSRIDPGPDKIGEPIRLLCELLRSKAPQTAQAGAQALGGFGEKAQADHRARLEALHQAIEGSRTARNGPGVSQLLLKMLANSTWVAGAVAALCDASKSPDQMLRFEAVRALGEFGPLADSALPAVRSLRGDTQQGIAYSADEAESKISPRPRPVRTRSMNRNSD